jgi:hypothetical protein
MPVNLHLYLRLVFQAGGFLGCTILVIRNMEQIEAWGINGIIAFFGAAILGGILPSAIFHFLIPARCPECSGRSVVSEGRSGTPITYNCKSCGHIHKTPLSVGKLRIHGD